MKFTIHAIQRCGILAAVLLFLLNTAHVLAQQSLFEDLRKLPILKGVPKEEADRRGKATSESWVELAPLRQCPDYSYRVSAFYSHDRWFSTQIGISMGTPESRRSTTLAEEIAIGEKFFGEIRDIFVAAWGPAAIYMVTEEDRGESGAPTPRVSWMDEENIISISRNPYSGNLGIVLEPVSAYTDDLFEPSDSWRELFTRKIKPNAGKLPANWRDIKLGVPLPDGAPSGDTSHVPPATEGRGPPSSTAEKGPPSIKMWGASEPISEKWKEREAWARRMASDRPPSYQAWLDEPPPDGINPGVPIHLESISRKDPRYELTDNGPSAPEEVLLPKGTTIELDKGEYLGTRIGNLQLLGTDVRNRPASWRVVRWIAENKAETVSLLPRLNFNETRRWYIESWTWLSDNQLIGFSKEEDGKSEPVIKSHFYLYDVSRGILRTFIPPDEINSYQSLEFHGVSGNGKMLFVSDQVGNTWLLAFPSPGN